MITHAEPQRCCGSACVAWFISGKLRDALLPRMYERLGLDTEGIGDAIDVVEIADDLGGIVDGAIVHTMCAEHIKIGGPHLLGCAGELFGVFTQSAIKG